MKTFFITTLLVVVLCSTTFAAPQITKDMSIAVMDLGTHEDAVPHEINILNAGKASSEYLIQRLGQLGLNVTDRTFVEEKFRAANLNTTGLIDPDTAKKIGELLGVDYLIYGNVNDVTLSETGAMTEGVGLDLSTITVKAHVIIRVMKIETGQIIGMSKGEGSSKGSFVKIKGGEILTVSVGRTKVTQDSVLNALQKAAFDSIDKLIKKN